MTEGKSTSVNSGRAPRVFISYARSDGVCVYPVKGEPDLDFNSLPHWMRSAHFYDLDYEWQKLVNDLL